MKRITALVMAVLLLAVALTSCKNDVQFSNIEYKEHGLSFALPNTMKRGESEDYEFYFTGMSMDVIFSAMKLTDEFLEKVDLKPGVTAKEYVDTIIARRELDKSKLFYKHYENSGQYNFRYNYVSESGFEMFYYVTVLGTPDNLWYVEMCCEAEESDRYVEMFDTWRRSIGTYS